MEQVRITIENYDLLLLDILAHKQDTNIVHGRLNLEGIDLINKSEFVISWLKSLNNIESVVCKIQYWEKDDIIDHFLLDLNIKKRFSRIPYLNNKAPGAVLIEIDWDNVLFFKSLLTNHFNHEMALDPSLNLRVQICVNQTGLITLLDIYDDRGLNIFFITQNYSFTNR